MYDEFTRQLQLAFREPLPGKPAQLPLRPYLKINSTLDAPSGFFPKQSAVMALFFPKDEIPHLLLIERPVYDGVHSGQIGFPGGKIEKSDATQLDAALRETYEEVGIHKESIQLLGPLTEVYVLASNFMVYPFAGFLQERPAIIPDEKEVAAILEVPVSKFFEAGIVKEKPIKSALGFTLMAPYFDIYGKTLWGATAMMISELRSVISKTEFYE
jgi:8-oxo-dGTP pyrophosphatase MutT (NUDIX family)